MSDLYSMNMDYVIIQVLMLEINILVSLWLKNDVYFFKKRVYYNVSFMVFTCVKMHTIYIR